MDPISRNGKGDPPPWPGHRPPPPGFPSGQAKGPPGPSVPGTAQSVHQGTTQGGSPGAIPPGWNGSPYSTPMGMPPPSGTVPMAASYQVPAPPTTTPVQVPQSTPNMQGVPFGQPPGRLQGQGGTIPGPPIGLTAPPRVPMATPASGMQHPPPQRMEPALNLPPGSMTGMHQPAAGSASGPHPPAQWMPQQAVPPPPLAGQGPMYPQPLTPPAPGYGGMAAQVPAAPFPGQRADKVAGDYLQVSLGVGASPAYPAGPGGPPTGYGMPSQSMPDELPRPLGDTLVQSSNAIGRGARAEGNCSPATMRMSVHAFPRSTAIKRQWHLPFGAVIHPLAEEGEGHNRVPVVGLTAAGIVRCRRCRTYMNPFMQFADGGRRFRCNLCGLLNDVPVEYFCSLDEGGNRRDKAERPELTHGTVEFVAPQEYMVRPPMPPVYFFMLDVSAGAKSTGAVTCAITAIKASLDQIAGDGRTRFGLMTFDETLHFYDLSGKKSSPQMFVVSDLEEPFLPTPDDLLVNLVDAREQIDRLMDALHEMHSCESGVTGGPGSALGPALRAAYMVMGHIGGRLIVLQSSLPTLGNGSLKPREDAALYGTDREHTLRQPGSHFYKKYAAECSRVQISVDVIAAPPPPPPGGQSGGLGMLMDLPSLEALSEYTCGQLSYFPSFSQSRDGGAMQATIMHALCRPTGWEAVMRIRCSTGLKISAFHGHFFVRSTDLLALPAVDTDKAFSVDISLEETVISGQTAYMQCALLYTTSAGERRIRVHNLAAPIVDDLGSMYLAADEAVCAVLLAQASAERTMSNPLSEARTSIVQRVGKALREYRSLYGAALAASPQKLALPTTLKNLPAYALGIVRGDALRGGPRDVHPDQRAMVRFALGVEPIPLLLRRFWPAVYSLRVISECRKRLQGVALDDCLTEATVPTSQTQLDPTQCYAVDDGTSLILWVGYQVEKQEAEAAAHIAALLDSSACRSKDGLEAVLKSANGVESTESFAWLMAQIVDRREAGMCGTRCFCIQQGTPSEALLSSKWMEDQLAASMGYREFLTHLHRMSGGG